MQALKDYDEELKPNQEAPLIEISPEEIPPFLKDIPFKIIQYAIMFGHIKWSYTLRNYIEYAVETGGYETLLIWGVQGSRKSNRTLQEGYWVYQDWDRVLKNIAFKPKDKERGVIDMLKKIPKGSRVPWMGWDDMTVHYGSLAWRTDVKQYEAVDSLWAALRTKATVMSLNCPIIDRVAKNIKDNLSMEVYLGRNQVEMINRIVRMPGINHLESNLFKIQVEPFKKFDMFDVPTDVFKEYWELRLELGEEALNKAGDAYTLEEIDLTNYYEISDLVARWQISPRSITRLASDGALKGEKFNGTLYLNKQDVLKLDGYYLNRVKK